MRECEDVNELLLDVNPDITINALAKISNGSKLLHGNACFINDYDNQDEQNTIPISQNFEINDVEKLIDNAEEEELPPQTISGHIMVYSACFEKTDKWKFKYNNIVQTIDISESDVVSYMKGKFIDGDTFYVQMEVIERKTAKGYTNDYKVIKVFKFTRGAEQQDLPNT